MPTTARGRGWELNPHQSPFENPNEVTDIVPFNEFGSLADLDGDLDLGADFQGDLRADVCGAFPAADAAVLNAPELDDLLHAENVVPLILQPRKDLGDTGPGSGRHHRPVFGDLRDDLTRAAGSTGGDAGEHAADAYDSTVTDVLPRVAQHRKTNPNALKGRVMIAAMAAGAAAAAAHTAINSSTQESTTKTVLAADRTSMGAVPSVSGNSDGMQLVTVTPALNSSTHSEEVATGVAFAQERAEREARLQRPLFVMPTHGIFTSGFGYRWGALHAGIDLANSIGTPIYAVSDGVVIAAGPTAGYGAYVKLRHADGTVTLYGHVNSWLVNVGQRVMAGDEIATIGNRGNSTGPHLHFEVMPNGQDRIDPVPWLAARGISLGG
ncbi:M23 family metallopeptidase [Mycolicibacterium palauense]|uniref:M23 family metallopeptidase n=1 Tax=Mycolicibacterium palauense TaxID=2034511 RepID=UPI000BFEC1E8|nr:M23 family metallopeptidase [Mycolicibacterium palauense]